MSKGGKSEKRNGGSGTGEKPGKREKGLALTLAPMRPPAPAVASAREREALASVLERLWGVVMTRRGADPAVSHSARLLARGIPKVAQKFGEEAVECLIEAVAGNRAALIGESADVLYHLIVLWVASGVRPEEVWEELVRREGVSGIAEKAARGRAHGPVNGVHKIP